MTNAKQARRRKAEDQAIKTIVDELDEARTALLAEVKKAGLPALSEAYARLERSLRRLLDSGGG